MPRTGVTDHARQRVRERVGVSKKSAARTSELAWRFGLINSETSGPLRRYMDAFALKYPVPKSHRFAIRIYGFYTYVYSEEVATDLHHLITVVHLPKKYQNRAKELLARKKQQRESSDENSAD